ncbi:phage repressor protein [Salmonella enterica]|uniref:Phage repressor protein n=1 Tax=Salmonella enterica TaxID=28901 RepID=A0A743Z5K5_SALER|nr:phage repressor protein [Salmonella enterica]EDA1261033.1 phage repressor protein [Salmonella enterica subsp. enterica serovar Idikan]EDN4226289.1 phage repressor protein [Salmonella enterica subsp. enterica serovar Pomona]EED8493725.1 phage repressor protein [Salmonella enterica subsp. enterica]EHL4602457.1 phage repressor protein CI [Salmonella enterica subsp. enterica serovar Glostrup]ELE5229222.1 phage repressor protein CI [Salmonella enterica subsp. enterica serovar Colindale]HBI55027
MSKFSFTQSGNSAEVLDRIIDAYGFSSKLALADHFDMASSSLSGRYRRDNFPADMVVQCCAETGVSLEWLATGQGKKFDDEQLDIMKFSKKKLVDGQLYDSGFVMFDKVFFKAGTPLPADPICVQDEKAQYILDQKYAEVFDGEWLVNIEGKTSIRTLTRIPVKKVRISGVGMAFDCRLEDIEIIGRVVMTITNA